MPTRFGQLVIGPPGSGKTTYCQGMHQFLTAMGRKVSIINLDPANDNMPFKPAVDLSDLVSLEDVMQELRLGPNGGLIYCMEFLEKNISWLKAELDQLPDHYLIFDCPGQVELYTHHSSVQRVAAQLQQWDIRPAAVHLTEANHCCDPGRFIAAVMTSLNAMVKLELPHINVLSKIDQIELLGPLPFALDFFTDVLDLGYLLEHLSEDRFFARYRRLNEALCGVVEDYSLVAFTPLNIQDKRSLGAVMKRVDQANGCGWGDLESRDMQSMLSAAIGQDTEFDPLRDVQEKYMKATTQGPPVGSQEGGWSLDLGGGESEGMQVEGTGGGASFDS